MFCHFSKHFRLFTPVFILASKSLFRNLFSQCFLSCPFWCCFSLASTLFPLFFSLLCPLPSLYFSPRFSFGFHTLFSFMVLPGVSMFVLLCLGFPFFFLFVWFPCFLFVSLRPAPLLFFVLSSFLVSFRPPPSCCTYYLLFLSYFPW